MNVRKDFACGRGVFKKPFPVPTAQYSASFSDSSRLATPAVDRPLRQGSSSGVKRSLGTSTSAGDSFLILGLEEKSQDNQDLVRITGMENKPDTEFTEGNESTPVRNLIPGTPSSASLDECASSEGISPSRRAETFGDTPEIKKFYPTNNCLDNVTSDRLRWLALTIIGNSNFRDICRSISGAKNPFLKIFPKEKSRAEQDQVSITNMENKSDTEGSTLTPIAPNSTLLDVPNAATIDECGLSEGSASTKKCLKNELLPSDRLRRLARERRGRNIGAKKRLFLEMFKDIQKSRAEKDHVCITSPEHELGIEHTEESNLTATLKLFPSTSSTPSVDQRVSSEGTSSAIVNDPPNKVIKDCSNELLPAGRLRLVARDRRRRNTCAKSAFLQIVIKKSHAERDHVSITSTENKHDIECTNENKFTECFSNTTSLPDISSNVAEDQRGPSENSSSSSTVDDLAEIGTINPGKICLKDELLPTDRLRWLALNRNVNLSQRCRSNSCAKRPFLEICKSVGAFSTEQDHISITSTENKPAAECIEESKLKPILKTLSNTLSAASGDQSAFSGRSRVLKRSVTFAATPRIRIISPIRTDDEHQNFELLNKTLCLEDDEEF